METIKNCRNCIGHNTWEQSGKCNGFPETCDCFQPGKAPSREEMESERITALASKNAEKKAAYKRNVTHFHHGILRDESDYI